MVGKFLGHRLYSKTQRAELEKKTEEKWKLHFGNKVPFNDSDPNLEQEMASFESRIKYDIASAASRQRVFYYQVSLDHYRDPAFLADALVRYKMYLCLKKRHPKEFLVPCYDMDLIWHSHQVHPLEYNRDTRAVLGFVLKHDDSVNDRSEGSKLNNADDVTRKLWYETFKVHFARPGSMFRGNPPHGKLFNLTEKYQKGLLAPKKMDVELNSLRMASVPDLFSGQNGNGNGSGGEDANANKAVVTVQLETGSSGLLKKKCVELYSSECSLSTNTDDESQEVRLENPDGLVHFAVTHANRPKLNIKLASKSKKKSKGISGWFGVNNGRRASIALSETPIDLFSLAANKENEERSNSDEALSVSHVLAPVVGSDFILTEVKLNLTNERLGTPVESKFHIQPGAFYDCIIPEDVESLWGPIPLQKLPRGVSNKCRAVTHG